MDFRGEKREERTEAATDEFERRVGRRARGRDVFGHLMICVADMATEDDDDGGGEAQDAGLFVEDGAACDAAFRHSSLFGGGGGTTESGHLEFLTNAAAAAAKPPSHKGGRDFSAASLPPLSLFPSCKSKSALTASLS